jgi:hypothetical protein
VSTNNAPRNSRTDRRERAAEERAKSARRDRRRKIIVSLVIVFAVVIIAGGLIFGIASSHVKEAIPAAVSGPTTQQKSVARVTDTSGIPGVVTYDTKGYPGTETPDAGTLEHDHVAGPVVYSVVPPVGGPHNATWMNCGVYTKPVPTERAVHNLEHGAVWITYRPDLGRDQLAALRTFVNGQPKVTIQLGDGKTYSNRYLDLTPWTSNDLPAPIVVSSWGHQLRLDAATDSRLARFVKTFRASQTYTPEYGSPCDGVPVDIGGRPKS